MKIPSLRHLPLLLVAASFFTGCDIVKDDDNAAPKSVSATLYAFADKPAVINLASVSGGMDLVASGIKQPTFGTLEGLVGNKYLLYTPNSSFTGKQERLTMDLRNKATNLKFTDLDLTIKSLDGSSECGTATGVYDYVRIQKGSTLKFDLLANDIFCGVGYNGGMIGEVAIDNPSGADFVLALGPGRIATFNYTAPTNFTGKIRVIYNLGINWKNGSTGPIATEEILKDPLKYLDAFTTAMIEVEVVD